MLNEKSRREIVESASDFQNSSEDKHKRAEKIASALLKSLSAKYWEGIVWQFMQWWNTNNSKEPLNENELFNMSSFQNLFKPIIANNA